MCNIWARDHWKHEGCGPRTAGLPEFREKDNTGASASTTEQYHALKGVGLRLPTGALSETPLPFMQILRVLGGFHMEPGIGM